MKMTMAPLGAILSRPGPTLGRLAADKRWISALLIILLAISVISYITLPDRLAESRRLLAESGLGDMLSEDGGWMRITPFRRLLLALWTAFITAIVMMIAAFLTYLFYGVGGAEGDYTNFFALIVNASLIGALIPQVIGLIEVIAGIPLPRFLNLAGLLPLQGGTLLFFALGQINIIYIWYLIAVALGAAHFAQISRRRSLIIITAYFLFISVIKVAFSYLRVQLMG